MANKDNKPIEEYLIKLVPQLDKEKYEKEKSKIDNLLRGVKNYEKVATKEDIALAKRQVSLQTALSKLTAQKEKTERERLKTQKESIKKTTLELKQQKESARLKKVQDTISNGENKKLSSLIKQGLSGNFGSLGKSGVILTAIFGVLKIIKDYTEKIVDESTKLSNSLISGSSAFVDKNTRSTMATFGVGSMTAMGINNALSLMGISTSDMATMTGGQMQLFAELMQQWTEGMSIIDKSAISEYNEYMQSFQKDIASIKLDAQIAFYKYLVENRETINSLLNSVTQIFSLIIDYATGSTGQQILTLLTQISTFVINALTMSAKLSNMLSPILDIILAIANVVMSVINIIYTAIQWVFDKVSGILDFLGIDVSPITEGLSDFSNLISSGSNYVYDSAVSGSGTNYNGNGNYGTITITQTTNNSFTGSDSNSYAVANSMAQSQQTWLSRQLATSILE